MKKTVLAVIGFVFSVSAFAASPYHFKTDSGVANTERAISVARVGVYFTVTNEGVDASGQPIAIVNSYPDVSGAAFANFQAAAAGIDFYRVPSTNKYLSARMSTYTDCAAGAYSRYNFQTGAQLVADNCASYSAMRNLAK